MNVVAQQLEKPQMPPQAVLAQMTFGFIVSQAISVAAKLYIADQLQTGPKTIGELADATRTDEPSLYRLMRTLMSVGIFQKDSEGRYTNTALSEFLRADHPESLRGIAHMMCDREHWQSFGNMMQSVKTGENGFEYTFGMPFFQYAGGKPEIGRIFDDAMTSFSRGIANAVVKVYDFSGEQTIADIGGGHGILLSTILKANDNAKGILFDQPHVIADADDLLALEGVSDRAKIDGGDFFAEVPVSADVYLMKHILHDWNDQQSETILKNLAKAAKPGAKLLLVESVVEEDDATPSISKVMDLNMLVNTGGKERTEKEYARLLEDAGFKLTNIYPTPSPVQIIEAVRS
jgi:hypothetical protein